MRVTELESERILSTSNTALNEAEQHELVTLQQLSEQDPPTEATPIPSPEPLW